MMATHQSRRHYGAALVATALVAVGLPLAATSATPDPDQIDPAGPPDTGMSAWGSTSQDLLARLRMPSKSGPIGVPPPPEWPGPG